jgi:uncharacterized protein (DUF488 family)
VEIYTIGFTRTTAEHFFGRLRESRVERLLDVRLSNRSQLAGFAKSSDLSYFLRELVGAEYDHDTRLAPTKEILDAYKKRREMSWKEYERNFLQLMRERRIETALDQAEFARRTVLLCSEDEPAHCHRRLVAEYLADHWKDLRIVHL